MSELNNSGGSLPPQSSPPAFVVDIYLDSADQQCALAINSKRNANHLGAKPFEFTFFDEEGNPQSIRGAGKLTDMRDSSKQGDIKFLAAAPVVISVTIFTKGVNAGRGQVVVSKGQTGTPDYRRWTFVDLSSTY